METTEMGEGPWLDEPDYGAWRDGEFLCSINRSPLGILCGYVGVPVEHPAWGVDDDGAVDVHGGVTYEDFKDPQGSGPGYWWFGFDCGHFRDYVPGVVAHERKMGFAPMETVGSYKDWEYVRGEMAKMVEQLKAKGETDG
jgi:hypothetical protein